MPVATNRARLREHADGHLGYFTSHDAKALGVPVVELSKIAARGGVAHIAYGVYRMADWPASPRDRFLEATLLVGRDSYLSYDAPLALHGLIAADPINPARIRVATPRRVRRNLPTSVVMTRRYLPSTDVTRFGGIPSTTVARALADCVGLLADDQIVDATHQARRLGLVTELESERLLDRLGYHPNLASLALAT